MTNDEEWDSDETNWRDWCRALGVPCSRINGVVVSQPSSTAICAVIGALYLIFGILCLVENKRRGARWGWVDFHLDEFLGRPSKIRPGAETTDATKERCRFLYGAALIFNFFCLVFATASYQSFSYQLNCQSGSACIHPPEKGDLLLKN